MERCLHCNSVLTSKEKTCPNCGTKVDSRKWSFGETLAWLGRVIFFSAVIALALSYAFPESLGVGAVFGVSVAALALLIRR
jgi:hypothetical protein